MAWVFAGRVMWSTFADWNPQLRLDSVRGGVAHFEGAGDLVNHIMTAVHEGWACTAIGLHAEAALILRRCLAVAEARDLGFIIDFARLHLAGALATAATIDEAVAIAIEARDGLFAKGNWMEGGAAHGQLAELLLMAGDVPAAEREARAGAESLRRAPPRRRAVLATLARVLLAQGRATEALEVAREALVLVPPERSVEGDGRLRLALAETLAATGDLGAARAAIEDARARLSADAAGIREPAMRDSYLAIAEHARTLALAAELGAGS